MRYLNKIIFINSADKSLKYAEVNLDGNVHFIGTQGVGKSTLLRAILFFYNADKQKLGIKAGQKTYDEYYFPYQNSYIIYEVRTEHGLFCVMTFKSQGRVAFRFFDTAYDKKLFIDSEGKAYESWDKTRDAFGKSIHYTRIINNYEEYRNILYGNNKGLAPEFRKYALLESKQYQNIPRTVTNVFLNTKLDAEFVKETIIKSLHEDEIKIDLTTYSQIHLKDFETQLSDIKKWTDRNKNGDNQIEKQADKVADIYSMLKYLQKQEEELTANLGWALNHVKEQQPKDGERLQEEERKKQKTEVKLKELEAVFEKKKSDTQKSIGEFSSKLKEISAKRKEYEILKINEIIERVARKSLYEAEKSNLANEKGILTSKFMEIQQRYEALKAQFTNQWSAFENSKQKEKTAAKESFLHFKEDLNKQYDALYESIKTQHKAALEAAQSAVKEKYEARTAQKIKQAELKNRKFYEKEIEEFKHELSLLKTKRADAEMAVRQAIASKNNLEKQGQLDEKSIRDEADREIDRLKEKLTKIKDLIAAIDAKIENSKDSLYAWLNEHVPDWENTIGKVIDDEQVLFASGLNPQKVSENNSDFYGISIDLNEISKRTKTVADYETEKTDYQNQIIEIQKNISGLNNRMEKDLENLRRRYHVKIQEQKKIRQDNEYTVADCQTRTDELNVKLSECENRALRDKQEALAKIEQAISRLAEELQKEEAQVAKIEQSITETINKKRKEKEQKIKDEQKNMDALFSKIDCEISTEKDICKQKLAEIELRQKDELASKGADTNRIDAIQIRLSEIENELIFIENNRDKVAEYNKDKRELFDREMEFKRLKNEHENQAALENEKFEIQKEKLIQEIGRYANEIRAINQLLTAYSEDIARVESFKNSELFTPVETFFNNFTDAHQTAFRCTVIIDEINKKHYQSVDKMTDLQEAIQKFAGNFQENNLFSFKTKFVSRSDYFEFANNLKEFIEENKIGEYKKRFEERFAHIIRQIGKETQQLIEKEGEISQVIREINNDFKDRNFVGAIKSMELRTSESANTIFQLLVDITKFNNENTFDLGEPNLFSSNDLSVKNEKAIDLLKQLIKAMSEYGKKDILLSDSFELHFKIIENDNDSGWVEKLTNVGSEGTDTLVKAMINILLLNVFKEKVGKKNKGDFRLHCMMDEIGKLHPNNVKGILQFANDRNILLINSSPTTYNAADYRYTCMLTKDIKNITSVKRLVSKKS